MTAVEHLRNSNFAPLLPRGAVREHWTVGMVDIPNSGRGIICAATIIHYHPRDKGLLGEASARNAKVVDTSLQSAQCMWWYLCVSEWSKLKLPEKRRRCWVELLAPSLIKYSDDKLNWRQHSCGKHTTRGGRMICKQRQWFIWFSSKTSVYLERQLSTVTIGIWVYKYNLTAINFSSVVSSLFCWWIELYRNPVLQDKRRCWEGEVGISFLRRSATATDTQDFLSLSKTM